MQITKAYPLPGGLCWGTRPDGGHSGGMFGGLIPWGGGIGGRYIGCIFPVYL